MEQKDVKVLMPDTPAQKVADYSDDQILIFDNIKAVTDASPVRAQMNCLLICVRGKMTLNLNGMHNELKQNDILLFLLAQPSLMPCSHPTSN